MMMVKTSFFEASLAYVEICAFLANAIAVGIALFIAISAKGWGLFLIGERLFFYYVFTSIL
jgi:hypothetical protein